MDIVNIANTLPVNYSNQTLGMTPEANSNERKTIWKSLKSGKEFEAHPTCQRCGKTTLIHRGYVDVGMNCCIGGNGRCIPVAKATHEMLRIRGWSLIDIKKGTKNTSPLITFSKKPVSDHQCTIYFDILKGGGDCKSCVDQAKIIPSKQKKERPIRPECDCREMGKGKGNGRGYGRLCVHYNHAVSCPDSAEEWDYDLNYPVRPEDISVNTHTKYWWKCRNHWCRMSYEQEPASRANQGQRCPYCNIGKPCHWNCLSTTHPELVKEWSPSNTFTPDMVTHGSHVSVEWICSNYPSTHRWIAQVNHRAIAENGCPACNSAQYQQETRGHEYFVEVSMQIHRGKYSYPERYINNLTPIGIYCPVLDPHTRKPHGLFKQTPNNHKTGYGCSLCAKFKVSRGIRVIDAIIEELGYKRYIDYILEKSYQDLRGVTHPLRFDRYITSLNLLIEYDGQQHFSPAANWGGLDAFHVNRHRDLLKDDYCYRNKINIMRIPYHIKDESDIRIFINGVIDMCKKGLHVHASYAEFISLIGVTARQGAIIITVPKPPVKKIQ